MNDIAIYKLICIIPKKELSEKLIEILVYEHNLTSSRRLYISEVKKEDFSDKIPTS